MLARLARGIFECFVRAGAYLDSRHWFKWLAVLGGVVAILQFAGTQQNSLSQQQYQAWQLLNSSKDITGDGGRTLALQRLTSDGIALHEVYLSKANISFIRLRGAQMQNAVLEEATADYALFQRANLAGTWASRSKFQWACFTAAVLTDVDFQGANLQHAIFDGADLRRAKLRNTNLRYASFQRADLRDADLTGADLEGASFKGANLINATLRDLRSWRGADMTLVNFQSARGYPEGFRDEVITKWRGQDSFTVPVSQWEVERNRERYSTSTRCR